MDFCSISLLLTYYSRTVQEPSMRRALSKGSRRTGPHGIGKDRPCVHDSGSWGAEQSVCQHRFGKGGVVFL